VENVSVHFAAPSDRLLTQNSELRRNGIYNWTIPAFNIVLSDGSRFNCCPNAGSCARVCYARFGTYRFSNVAKRHLHNLEYLLQYPDAWETQMLNETAQRRFAPSGKPHTLPIPHDDRFIASWSASGGKAVRIHDAGDFFELGYFLRWVHIAEQRPQILFYAYTKENEMIMPFLSTLPENMRIIFSYGGRQDHLIDRDIHRHADVFPTLEALEAAGYFNQEDNDILAAVAPTTRIGIVQNNLPVARKRFAGRSMSELQDRSEP
jgi:hypothetical protein